MPQVTLLGNEGNTYTLFQGVKEYFFEAGVPQDVPVSVALEAQKKRKAKDEPMFEVSDLPNIVGIKDDDPPVVPEEAILASSGQNVDRKLTNLRFETWL